MNTRTSYTNINIANQWYGTNAYSETHKKLPEEKNYMTLTTNQKQNLRTQAHHLDPIIQIGKNGVTPQQLSQIKKGLEDHELVKIKYIAHKNKKETLSKEISGFFIIEIGSISSISFLIELTFSEYVSPLAPSQTSSPNST